MIFDNRIWKLDLDNLWFNNNRRSILDSLIKLNSKPRFRAHLTGTKGAGKSTLITALSDKIQDADEKITKALVEHIAKKKLKLRY